MNQAIPNKKPSFFWQGTLILLPVTILAVIALISLRSDEQAAEQEGRKRAAENVSILTRAIRTSVNDDLERFMTVQNEWMLEMHSASQSAIKGEFPDEILKKDLSAWERIYPDLKMDNLTTPQNILMTDGHQIEPPDFADVPVPPNWYQELTLGQKKLWLALRNAEVDPGNANALKAACRAFQDSGVTEEAREAANCVLLPSAEMAGNDRLLPSTESGIRFQDLACYRILSTNKPTSAKPLPDGIWKRVIRYPSFAAPTLLDMAERLTNGADAVVGAHVHWMREYWRAQCRARDWLGPLRTNAGLATNWNFKVPWSSWTKDNSSEALAIFQASTFRGAGEDSNGYNIAFVPRPVIAAIFEKALAENRLLVPGYANAALTVQGLNLQQIGISTVASSGPLLGKASASFGKGLALNAVSFELSFYLTDRQLMLAAAQERASRFKLLIAAAAAVGLFGFFAARRAFYRQLRLNEMKSNFVSSVSHELRAPIASVRLMAEGLERGKIIEPQKQHEYFKFIVQECRRLSSLIENVLDFSRIEQGRKEYEVESTDLVAMATQTVKLMKTYAAEQDVRISFEVKGEPMPVELDGKAMQQALVNLIDNAIKHSPKGAEVKVGVQFSEYGEQTLLREGRFGGQGAVLLWVEDKGEGIPLAEHEKIFERFYRIGSELRRETQGVGIGLSIVKHIVEAHRGKVTVRSAVGEGSRFTIELPAGNQDGREGMIRSEYANGKIIFDL